MGVLEEVLDWGLQGERRGPEEHTGLGPGADTGAAVLASEFGAGKRG